MKVEDWIHFRIDICLIYSSDIILILNILINQIHVDMLIYDKVYSQQQNRLNIKWKILVGVAYDNSSHKKSEIMNLKYAKMLEMT